MSEVKTKPYNGYYLKPVPEDDFLLTNVGPGTPCGEYLRRYWHPFLLSSEVKDLPVATKLLGEELVVFRDKSGRLGLLHKYCAHRGVSLEFGIPTEKGIKCCYHGWNFDIDGTILDTPAEPPTSRIKENFSQGAYPVKEENGLIFAYLGPPEYLPPFPHYDIWGHPAENKLLPIRINIPCNWLQIVENGSDPIHNAYLHAIVAGQQFSKAFKVLPQLDFPMTPLGFLSMATRKVGEYIFIRSSEIALPNVGHFPNGSNGISGESFALKPLATRWAVAVDDHHSSFIGFIHKNEYNESVMQISPDECGVDKFPFIGQTADRPYADRQREPGDFDALVSPGHIANRKIEHLGTTDRGVSLARRLIASAIRAVEKGETPELPRLNPNGFVNSFAHEIVIKAPDFPDNPEKLALFGRQAAMAFVELSDLSPIDREKKAEVIVRDILKNIMSN